MPISHAHLRSFHAVATHGSFTRAAEMLNITQPTLSGQVKDLETRYGTKLFIRLGRRIELTDIGRSAFNITRLLFRHEEEVEHLLQSARALTSGELRVAADSPYIATPLLAQFQRIYPGIQISIQYGNSQQLMSWIESRRCDVAFLPNIPQGEGKLFSIPLMPDRLVVFVSQDHEWAERRAVSIEELLTQRVILREKGSRTRSIFEEAIIDAGLQLDNVMEISGREGVREAVAAGFGVGIVAENELLADSRLRALRVSNADLVHAEYVVCLQEMRSLRVNDAFLEMIRASQKDLT
ncbi:MAG: LysR family transcriptional regulator [Gammaproteobacteria bacterium]|jgi:aminoethylphosphonate catabolism LysR family transcriptional regulator|nr:LysR family transcriptional regulator [Gammaproteobacteria bacterium]HUV23416.1 LysR substrate-binding domain-containing protein [Gammaproteobacteria bacterium]